MVTIEVTRADQLKGHTAMLSFSAFVAGSFALGSRVANDIDPAALTTLRFIAAAVLMAIWAVAAGQVTRKLLEAPWRHIVMGGLYGAYFVLMFEGLKTATSVSTAAVFTLTPLMAAGFGWLLLRQSTTPRMALALFFGVAGALWVIFRGSLSAFLEKELDDEG